MPFPARVDLLVAVEAESLRIQAPVLMFTRKSSFAASEFMIALVAHVFGIMFAVSVVAAGIDFG